MVLTESLMVPLGSAATDFFLKGVEDKVYSLSDFSVAKVLVIIFMCNHCPYVQKIWPELVSLVRKTSDEAAFVGINANANPNYPDDSFENMKVYAKKMHHNFPYLYDENQNTAKAYGAVCTPDIFVYDSDRKLRYRGHFSGLEEAINLLIQGKIPGQSQKPSMGCSIKWN